MPCYAKHTEMIELLRPLAAGSVRITSTPLQSAIDRDVQSILSRRRKDICPMVVLAGTTARNMKGRGEGLAAVDGHKPGAPAPVAFRLVPCVS